MKTTTTYAGATGYSGCLSNCAPRSAVCSGCQSCTKTSSHGALHARLLDGQGAPCCAGTTEDPTQIGVTRHRGRRQPHTVCALACLAGGGLLLAGQLAELARDADPQQLPVVIIDQLTASSGAEQFQPRQGCPGGCAAAAPTHEQRSAGDAALLDLRPAKSRTVRGVGTALDRQAERCGT